MSDRYNRALIEMILKLKTGSQCSEEAEDIKGKCRGSEKNLNLTVVHCIPLER